MDKCRRLYISCFVILNFIHIVNSANIGLYRTEILMAGICNAPKDRENGGMTVTMLGHGNISTGLRFEGEVYKTMGPLGLKLVMMRMDGDRNITVMTRVCKNLCNSIITSIYLTQMNLLDKKCYIKPGSYVVNLPDFNKFLHYLIRRSFFYAKFLVKVTITAGGKQISCSHYVVQTVMDRKERLTENKFS